MVICQWQADQRVEVRAEANKIDLHNTDKSGYFVTTNFNNYIVLLFGF